ncbi:MAG: helix-turn-helix transcriptional regulator [Oscillospiraceae bacterium]|nr:helix-turn-helix transcriptional regulator [Oscillospiraceae bacterium]
MVDTQKIQTRMKERKITQVRLAERLGLAKATVSQKLNNVRPMFLDEAEAICEALEIPDDEFGAYFFKQ